MLCQKCHKNLASVRYAEVVDGQVNNLHLCQDCLDRQQDDAEVGFELGSPTPFAGVRANVAASISRAMASVETCDACETSLQTIMDTGRVGCSTCYETFPAQLEALLEGMHVAVNHRGKNPRTDDTRARIRADLQNKRALLKTALNLENYEEAAGLRDDIRALETGLGASEAGVD